MLSAGLYELGQRASSRGFSPNLVEHSSLNLDDAA